MSEPQIQLPEASVWPLALAAGLTLTLFGVLTSPALSAAGTLLAAVALGGWIRELRHG
ncbi:MAG TPA: hypothetical protein VEQ11_13270 [Chloroflexota bacterium]|nr:hypothetical protein [Chloroflexota bacterium]